MKDKRLIKELEDLERSLAMNEYRKSSMFSGPGIDETEKKLKLKIKEIKAKLNKAKE